VSAGAIRAGRASVEVTLDTAKFSRGLARVSARLKGFGDRMARIGRTVAIVGGGITALGTVAFARFEKAMSRVRALTGATGESMDKLSAAARELGKTTVFSATQAADAMGNLAQAGFTTEEIMSTLPGILNLAAAANIEISEAASITARTLRQLGLDASDTTRVVDVLTKGFTSSLSSLTDLGEGLRGVGSVARVAGLGLEETVATLEVLADAGKEGEKGGIALRNILAKLTLAGSETEKVFTELGVSTADIEGNLRPLADIIDDVNASLGKSGGLDKLGKLIDAFGLRAGPAFADLLARGGDGLRKFQDDLNDAGGTSARVAAIQLANLSGQFTILRSAVTESAIAIGQKLAPFISKLIQVVQGLVDRFNALGDTIQRNIARAAITVTALGATIIAAAIAFKALALAVSVISVALNPVTIAVVAIGTAFLLALDLALQFFGRATTGFTDFLTNIKIGGLTIAAIFQIAWLSFFKAFERSKEFVLNSFDAFVLSMREIGAIIFRVWLSVGEGITKVLTGAAKAGVEAFNTLTLAATKAANTSLVAFGIISRQEAFQSQEATIIAGEERAETLVRIERDRLKVFADLERESLSDSAARFQEFLNTKRQRAKDTNEQIANLNSAIDKTAIADSKVEGSFKKIGEAASKTFRDIEKQAEDAKKKLDELSEGARDAAGRAQANLSIQAAAAPGSTRAAVAASGTFSASAAQAFASALKGDPVQEKQLVAVEKNEANTARMVEILGDFPTTQAGLA